MACPAAHCINHGTGTTTCSGHRSGCGSNNILNANPVRGQTILAGHIEELRARIVAEINAYNAHAWYSIPNLQPSPITTGTPTNNDLKNNLETMLHSMIGGGAHYKANADGITIDDSWNKLVEDYNQARTNCICNADCSCNNVCNCFNDCGCNYSDKRLKREIEYC